MYMQFKNVDLNNHLNIVKATLLSSCLLLPSKEWEIVMSLSLKYKWCSDCVVDFTFCYIKQTCFHLQQNNR